MPDLGTRQDDDRLTIADSDALQKRVSPAEESPEVAGMTPETERESLHAGWAERAPARRRGTYLTWTVLISALTIVLIFAGSRVLSTNLLTNLDRQLEDAKAENARRIRKHAPFPYKTTVHTAPPGSLLTVIGRECVATADPPHGPRALTREASKAWLTQSLRDLVRTVVENDSKAPHDGKSPLREEMPNLSPLDGFVTVTLRFPGRGIQTYIPVAPSKNVPARWLDRVREATIKRIVDDEVEGEWQFERSRERYEGNLDERGVLYPPPGFRVSVAGRQTVGSATGGMLVPMNAVAARKRLETVLRALADKCRQQPLPQTPGEVLPAPLPLAFAKVQVIGPYDTLEFALPLGPSAQYRSAADAMRARDRMIAEQAAEAVKQIERLNDEWGSAR